jgi:RNA polymerase sigma factor (sigma-70 family)
MKLTKVQMLNVFYENRKNYYNLAQSYHLEFDEVIQESSLRILDARKNEYEFETEMHLYMFLRRVVINLCIDEYRRNNKTTDYSQTNLINLPVNDDYDEFKDTLLDIILSNKEISKLQQLIIKKHYWDGLRYREIAEELKCPSVNLRCQFLRAKVTLKKCLKLKMEE